MTALPAASPNVVWTPLPDGAVLFSTDTEVYFGINDVGALAWGLLPPASGTLEELCASVQSKYPTVPIEQIRADITELLDDLLRLGLVHAPHTS